MAEGIALSVAFISTFVLTILSSLLRRTEIFTSTISHWLLTWHLPTCRWELWVYYIHLPCRLRIPASWIGTEKTNKPLYIFFWSLIFFFSQASLISEPSYPLNISIFLPVKHRTLSTRVYTSVIFTVWTLALLISATRIALNLLLFYKHNMFIWGPHTLILVSITCGCNP